QHASDLHALAQVASLPSVDDRLLEEVAARCSPPGGRNSASLGELARWAEERLKLARLGIAVAEDWVVVADASRLLTGCETAERELAALQAPSADELIRRYADPNDGWWRLDDLHRGLELRFDACRSGIVEHLGQPAVAALWKWSRQLAQQFADAFERSGGYAAPADVIPHHRFWSELVETGDLGETAILYVDALRLDLAEKLIGLLSQPGRTVTRRLALGSLPSKTPVGMASLLPRRGQSLVVLAKREKLRAEIGGRDVSDRPDRVAHLRQAVANLEVGELKQITESQLRAWAIARRPVLLTTLDIDNSGEIAATVAPKLFEDLIADLARWVTVLHRAGYRRVAIGTDHGFLLVPEGVSLGDVPAPQKASDVAISTRYAVGPLQTPNGCLGFDASALGYGGTARVVVPKGLTAFSVAGPRHRFIHGGLSPQECLLRFVISTQAGPPKAPVQVRLAPVPNVASLILYLQAEVTSSHGSAQARRVRVEARHGSRVVGRSDIVVYKPELELGPAEAYPRIKVTLTEPVPAVDLILLDEDSGDELDSQLGVPNVMRREADEDLL
ncbi:MAG TPA: PglZ domain-containing protein, partial [Gemmataceae bacterium]|nr:PglZ domain-containing protein [Gemmataceae bacterium]